MILALKFFYTSNYSLLPLLGLYTLDFILSIKDIIFAHVQQQRQKQFNNFLCF